MGNVTDERTSQSDIEQVKERVQDVAGQAKDQTRTQLREQIDTRTTQAGEQLSSAAQAIRSAGQQLRDEGNDRAAGMIDAIADRGQRLGSYLTGTDGDRLLGDVEDFARRQPWLIATAGAVAGFLGARFVKASAGDRYQARSSDRSSSWSTQHSVTRPASPSAVGGGVSGIH
jgi:hypothetical protein